MEPNSSPANPDPVAPAVAEPAEYTNPNDLATELTEAEEIALVDATLGFKGAKASVPEPTPAEVPEPVAGTGEPEITTPSAEPIIEAPVTPEPPEVVAIEAPAEITAPVADDLWVEVQDSEGNNVKLVYDPENPSLFLPAGFVFKDDQQLFEIMEAKNEMANLYKERISDFETKTAELETQENRIASDAAQTAAWDSEIQDLIEGGFLETPKVKQGDKNFLEDPTVQKIDAVFKFMTEQNKTRLDEGKPVLRSFGIAFNLYNKVSEDAVTAEKTKKDNELAKARGSLVGGTSAPSAGTEPPLYKIGSAKSSWEAVRDIQ